VKEGKEPLILEVSGERLLRILTEMNLLHMNDATRAMLRDRYPNVYKKLLDAQYDDAERRLLVLLANQNHKYR
jgi:hypothetical protein